MIHIVNKIHILEKHVSIFCWWNFAGIGGLRNCVKEMFGQSSSRKDGGHLSSVRLTPAPQDSVSFSQSWQTSPRTHRSW